MARSLRPSTAPSPLAGPPGCLRAGKLRQVPPAPRLPSDVRSYRGASLSQPPQPRAPLHSPARARAAILALTARPGPPSSTASGRQGPGLRQQRGEATPWPRPRERPRPLVVQCERSWYEGASAGHPASHGHMALCGRQKLPFRAGFPLAAAFEAGKSKSTINHMRERCYKFLPCVLTQSSQIFCYSTKHIFESSIHQAATGAKCLC